MNRNECNEERQRYEPPKVRTISACEVLEQFGPAVALYGPPPNFFGEEWS